MAEQKGVEYFICPICNVVHFVNDNRHLSPRCGFATGRVFIGRDISLHFVLKDDDGREVLAPVKVLKPGFGVCPEPPHGSSLRTKYVVRKGVGFTRTSDGDLLFMKHGKVTLCY